MDTALTTHHWQRMHGPAIATGNIKSTPNDFVVEEILGFEPSGEGEHTALLIEKINANTAFVAEQLAKFAGSPLRDVSYAGRKDKVALTRQWFTVYDKGSDACQWQNFALEGVSIKQITRHNRKIKIGSHKGNRFSIVVRDIEYTSKDALTERLEAISKAGFINYFGQQRFGEMRKEDSVTYNGNLVLAERLLAGEPIRHRNKRNIVTSALRSWLFNEFASRRIGKYGSQQLLIGDALLLSGSNSFFICDEVTVEQTKQRLIDKDVLISVPLWGAGKLPSTHDALAFETAIAKECASITAALESIQLKQQRRSIIAFPSNVEYHLENDRLVLSFALEKGVFATSLLREFMRLTHEESHENLIEQ